MPENPCDNLTKLRRQRTGVVVLAVLLAHRFNLNGQLAVPPGRDGREQVVFYLVAQISAHDVKELAACHVGGAFQLALVPVPFGLVS